MGQHIFVNTFIVSIIYGNPMITVELGGRVVRVLDSGQLHQSERSWVRFLDGPLKKIARPQDSHVVTWPAGDQEKHD